MKASQQFNWLVNLTLLLMIFEEFKFVKSAKILTPYWSDLASINSPFIGLEVLLKAINIVKRTQPIFFFSRSDILATSVL